MTMLPSSLPGKRINAGKWLQVTNVGGQPDSVELTLKSVELTGERNQKIEVWCPHTASVREVEVHRVVAELGSLQFPTIKHQSHLRVKPGTQRPSM